MTSPNDGVTKSADNSASLLPVDDNVQNVLEMLVAHSQGSTSNEALEAAVSQIVGPSAPPPAIDQDKDDYDNLETKPAASNIKKGPIPDESSSGGKKVTWSGPTATLDELRQDEEQ